jgi:hypothetical protein
MIDDLEVTGSVVAADGDPECTESTCRQTVKVSLELAGIGVWEYDTVATVDTSAEEPASSGSLACCTPASPARPPSSASAGSRRAHRSSVRSATCSPARSRCSGSGWSRGRPSRRRTRGSSGCSISTATPCGAG